MSTADYELYYHDCGGRGDYIRLLFVEAGVPYKEINDDMQGRFGGGELGGYPVFAPPAIKKGDFVLGETPVICRYLGKEFGLWPEAEADIWHAEMLNAHIHSFLAEGNRVFHARNIMESHISQQEYSKPQLDWFRKERLGRWLGMLERALAANQGGTGFLVGNKITYVDLALFHILRATEANFPQEYAANSSIPLLKAFRDRIAARPNIQAYLKSDKCRPFEGYSFM